ncbi:MAG: lysylphosphatidylglycerol synthase domain-containing protein [Planctomycetia bacterium]|nr:lysylphosphatidylglycerol synthase domain-containing protein [Planctomycetia bacterium]
MPTNPTPPTTKKAWKRFASLSLQMVLFALILYMIWGRLDKAWEQIASKEFRFAISWNWLLVGGIAYALALPFPASYWFCVLRGLGQPAGYYSTLRAHIVGHLGKYIPGKIFVVLIRSGLIAGRGISPAVGVISIFLEGLMQMATGALVFAALLVVYSIRIEDNPYALWLALLLMGGIAFALSPPVFRWGVRFVGMKKFSQDAEKLEQLSWKTYLLAIPWMLSYWLFLGISYWCVIRGIGVAVAPSVYPVCVAAIAGSMVAGFVLIFAPGGLGVRESLIVLLTTSMFAQSTNTPEAAALVSAAALRIVWIVVEMILAVLFFVIRPSESVPSSEVSSI